MADILEAMNRLDDRRASATDPAEIREINVEEEFLRQEYRERMGM